jgi:fatty-acyl-CoA synthase
MSFVSDLRDDFAYARGIFRTLRRVIPMARRRSRTFPDVAEELAARYGERPALLSARETLTYAGFNARANRYARWALANGVGKGDVVGLLMPNRPEYPAVWLGVARAGGVTALLNTNLRGAALAHGINLVAPKHLIIADELADAFAEAAPFLSVAPRIWRHGGTAPGPDRIDRAVEGLSDAAVPATERPALTLDDRCLFIYTSGTTGMPKAANVNHYRVLGAMIAFGAVMDAKAGDRMYDCLPLYHTVGGVIAVGAPLLAGGSVFIRDRFSASQFWDDVVDNDCTLFQYIGELCRYLVNAPPHPKEGRHRLRLCCGNGLRPDVWPAFKARFRIPHIREFYAATEGNALLFNFDDKPGSVGRIPRWLGRVFPITTVRYDVEAGAPVRGADGRCIECPPGEAGEMISRIVVDPKRPGQRFEGYADKEESERKVLRDVFEPGDAWFRTGDLMRRDARGNFYFVDRVGDTFRWKGENVSTSEVAEAISAFPGIGEANVYGVTVPGTEGRVGMAALVPQGTPDLAALRAHVHARLSPYARPAFLRLQGAIEATSTFKQRKIALVREGYDPAAVADPLYFDDPVTGAYVPLDAALHARIVAGEIRL